MEFDRVINEELIEIRNFLSTYKKEDVVNFLTALEEVQGKFVFIGIGKSGIIGRKISATFSSVGLPSMFIHPSEAFHGDLGALNSLDGVIFLSNSGESIELVQLIEHVNSKVDKTFSITSNSNSVISRKTDYHLEVKVRKEGCPLGLAPMASTSLLLMVGDGLASELIVSRNLTYRDFASNHPGGSLGKKLSFNIYNVIRPWFLEIIEKNTEAIIVAMINYKASAILISYCNEVRLYTDGDVKRFLMDRDKSNVDILEYGTKNYFSTEVSVDFTLIKSQMKELGIVHLVVHEVGRPIGIVLIHDLP